MWWLDPGKEVLNVLFNRILAPYVENLDMNQVNYGIGQGQLTLRNLRLKKGALDKFRLPVDVLDGHLGTFTLSLHWMNLGNQPVEVLIEDVYLLVVPSPQTNIDPEEEEQRAQATKAERLENAELLHMRGQAEVSAEGSPQSQGLWASLTAKIINNLQVTVKNIHVRYEDKMSVPGHPFAAGITLAGFTAESVNEKWEPAFIESTAGAIHKLASLQSLAVYFDTDSQSMVGLSPSKVVEKFSALISQKDQTSTHQFILKPVSGEGRIIMNHKLDNHTPHFDVRLFFDEIGVALDDNQYRDAISLVDMYHVYIRQHQYRKYRPSDKEFEENRAKALLRFAGKAILEGVHEQRRKWSWAYFAERRDDRNKYVELFERKVTSTLREGDSTYLAALERKLPYEDIRFYRSIARSRLRKDIAQRKKLEEERAEQQQQNRGWTAWLWGSSQSNEPQEDPAFGGPMTEEQRKQLYDALDYDEKSAIADSFEAPRDALKTRVVAELKKGSFALKTDPRGKSTEVISTVFDSFRADFIQRPNNFEASLSLGGFSVFDGTTPNTLYPQIVQVNNASRNKVTASAPGRPEDPFFFVKFESNPLDDRADTALTARMRHMEIIYHRGYLEAIWKFFKPPESQLESVEALLNVASQTLEGLRKETRAGLEYALQTHKTIDLQVDMNAPIIIIPEDITTNNCGHLVIDAGHISVESDLADKSAIREIQAKRNQQYSEDDYKRLESLMYDKMLLRLEAAQFVIGNDLQACRDALTSDKSDTLHILERINIDLQVQNSIVPSALNLARFKVSGKLPTLQVNLSDVKYKSLMRIIDVAIPNFDDDAEQKALAQAQIEKASATFPLPAGLFGQSGAEYNVDDGEGEDTSTSRDDLFFEANDGTSEHPEIRQHIFELDFEVENLRGAISRSNGDGGEKPLGDVTLRHFRLAFSLLKFNMNVDINLRSLVMNLVQDGQDAIQFASSEHTDAASNKDLLSVSYRRVQKASPEFASVYEGIDQSVDIQVSTFIFHAAPEPVVSLYDFIMTTFVPQGSDQPTIEGDTDQSADTVSGMPVSLDEPSSGIIRVAVKLESVQIMLINEVSNLATLSLSTADVLVLLRSNTMRITGRLGSLALSDDRSTEVALPEFKQIMSIEGRNFAEFRYQTFDPRDDSYSGIKSSVYLSAGSVKIHFLEQPLHDIYLFVSKLAKLKFLYDAAREAAVQRASEIERMQFEVSVKTPIIVFPSDPGRLRDVLIMRLGEISARNSYDDDTTSKVTASLRGIQVVSEIFYDDKPAPLKMVDDINIVADITQTNGLDRTRDTDYPDAQIVVKISDVKLYLTQVQYGLLVGLSKSIPRVLAGAPEGSAQASSALTTSSSLSSHASSTPEETEASVNLEPELRTTSRSNGSRAWTTLDLVISINAVKLHLYDGRATTENSLKDYGIARFALNDSTLRYKVVSDGAAEAQLVLRSFTMSNTRPGGSKFREIIPAAQHDRNQFMILYTTSGGASSSALAVVTVDSPQIIFAVEPVIALMEFFLSAFSDESPRRENDAIPASEVTDDAPQSQVDFRVDLHDVSISVLENDTDPDSQAIRLYIDQILLSQQGILALTVNRLGMSLIRMGADADTVRFLDDVDVTFSLDSRTSKREQVTSMEIGVKPIVLRASYRDIMLMTTIATKAVELYGKSQNPLPSTGSAVSTKSSMPPHVQASRSAISKGSQHQTIGKARVVVSKEQLKGSFDGFRLILIGDMHEQPMLHLKVKPFIIGAKDWSAELQATATLATQISYWNLTNSHWEPLIDPWTFTVSVARDYSSSELKMTLSARERLDLNVSTTFAELAITTVGMWGKEGVLQKARGSYAPYRIRNRTGSPVFVWSDDDTNRNAKDSSTVKVANDQTVDWRFDDWKTMREHVSTSEQHNIGIQFVGKPWEALRGIPVDREGEFTFSLRPRMEKYTDRLLCSVVVQDNVKIVTLRSTYLVENQTFYPLELMLVDHTGHPVYSLEKIAPGQDYSLPIEAVTQNRIRLQPDQGFGYRWCSSIRFDDLIAKKNLTISCPHNDQREAPFRFQAWVQTDMSDSAARKSPKIKLKLRAPIELENLLPYNLQYRIYDKDADQNWKSYLRKGGVMPVHSVELGHLILLNVEVQDTIFKPSDFTIINTDRHSDFETENRLTLRDQNDRKLDLSLNYVRYPESGGAFKVQIYSPYLLVNKSGLPFNAKAVRANRASSPQDVAGDTRPDVISRPVPFMLSHPQGNGQAFVFKVGESGWSKVFGLEAPAAETEMVVPSLKQKSEEYHLGLSWTEGLGKYKLTKVITIAPRFIIKNNLTEPIWFREHGVAPKGRSVVDPGERCPLQVMRASQDKLLTIAFPGLNTQWSSPINIEDIGSVHFRLPSQTGDQWHIIKANVKIDGSTIFVTFSRAEGCPFVIENDSDYTVSLSQTDLTRDSQPVTTSIPRYTLKPHTNMQYAWDQPAAREKKIMLTINDGRRSVDIMEIGVLMPFKFHDRQRTRAVSLDVRADGHKQVLRITHYVAENSVYKPKHRSTGSLARSDTMASSSEAFEAVTEDMSPTFSFNLELAGIGMSLVNRRMVEVIYISIEALKFEYNNSMVAQAVNLSCGSLQIDNQLHDALYPVILQPSPISKEATGVAVLPTIQGSVIWLKDQEHGVLFVKYCSILLQALNIETDEDLLFAMYDLTQIKGVSWEENTEDVLIQHPEEIPEPQDTAAGQDLYFEVLELQPIQLSLSFMRTERVSSEDKLSIRNPLAVMVNALTMTLGNVNDAPLELNALAIKDMRLTLPELQTRITYHYRQDVLRQLYRILGSADFIGNPVGLFTNVSSGVADIFYAPYNGVVMHGNKELGIGIAKGAASFVKKTVFGLSDSVTKFTSSVGKGLSAATFDSEYQAQRRMTQRRNRPRHAIYGVTAGGEAFASSIVSGLEGIVTKPIQGAESEGAFGFFKGVGKGLVGAVTKPAVGVFDLASNLSEGIRNTTTVFDKPERDRARPPRHVPPDGVLVPYAAREALGQYWMRDLDNGAYRKEAYVAHIDSPGGDNVVLLTASRVLSFWSKKLRLDWDLPLTMVQGVTVEDTGIRFAHKSGKDHDKFVFIPDKTSQVWFFGQIASVVKAFNNRRRMDT
ncbi:vacuolar protein sorting-associated protein 13 [Leucogyrophana mollusca]|uniref:Vacuolar protein sorting-associated protein 13 n=1 Tax=Leucogyrophana mollusca TaxID=85980 RepID=A0ACB8C1D5_9AGAM|nr:vacuolar protein sorting-associated protein 13 [Leucogyrophana mollusca]